MHIVKASAVWFALHLTRQQAQIYFGFTSSSIAFLIA